MLFRSLGSQESNCLNGAWIGVEMKKLWLFEDNCTKLSELSCENSQGVSQLRNHLLAHECHFAAPPPDFAAVKWAVKMSPPCKNAPWLRNDPWLRNGLQATNQVANHLQVAESPPSCKTKVQTCKMDNSTCESTRAIHLCNLRYLLPTKLDFFSRYFV